MPNPNLPETLVKLLRENRIIPFVGAGVSMSVKRRDSEESLFPSWKGLLHRAVDQLKNEGKTVYVGLVDSLIALGCTPGESESFFEAARKAKAGLGPNWNRFLSEQFGHSFGDVADGSLELPRLVWKLRSRLVITTNYDRVLRWACPEHHDLAVWNIEAPANQVAMLRGELKQPVVWHLHGHVDDIANIILTPDGYNRLYNDENQSKNHYTAALQTLKSQLASRSFLFVGFSLNDAYFSAQLRQVEEIYKEATGPHYVLLSRAEAERFNRKENPTIEVIPYDNHGPPLLAKLRELIAAAEATNETSLRATPSEGVSLKADKTRGKGGRKKSPQSTTEERVPPLDFNSERVSGAKVPDKIGTGSSEFDDKIKKVKQAIKTEFDVLKDRKMVDDYKSEVGVLDQTAEKLKLSTLSHGDDLSEQLADFLTSRRDYLDLRIILIVFQQLRKQKRYDEARRIGEIMDWMLPLCLPPSLVAEAWDQLQKDEKLICSGVGGKMGAELLVARLYWRPADFVDKNTSEPRGKRFVPLYEDFPIGGPDDGEAATLRGIYLATYHPEVKEIDGQKIEINLTTEEIRANLSGHYEHISGFEQMPAYCVVKLPSQKDDVNNLASFLRQLRIPGLLFIGIASKRDHDVHRIEAYIIQNLNTRYNLENES